MTYLSGIIISRPVPLPPKVDRKSVCAYRRSLPHYFLKLQMFIVNLFLFLPDRLRLQRRASNNIFACFLFSLEIVSTCNMQYVLDRVDYHKLGRYETV